MDEACTVAVVEEDSHGEQDAVDRSATHYYIIINFINFIFLLYTCGPPGVAYITCCGAAAAMKPPYDDPVGDISAPEPPGPGGP